MLRPMPSAQRGHSTICEIKCRRLEKACLIFLHPPQLMAARCRLSQGRSYSMAIDLMQQSSLSALLQGYQLQLAQLAFSGGPLFCAQTRFAGKISCAKCCSVIFWIIDFRRESRPRASIGLGSFLESRQQFLDC